MKDLKKKTFEIHFDPHGGSQLARVSGKCLTQEAWLKLAKALKLSGMHVPVRAGVLESRWERGLAALVVHGEDIISYTSLVALLNENIVARISEHWNLKVNLANTKIYEASSGWTHPFWRSRGIYTRLRRIAHEDLSEDMLAVTCCWGIGVSPILPKFGWTLVPWSQIPYVVSLYGVYEDGVLRVNGNQPIELELVPYEGAGSFPVSTPLHDWNQSIHFWVSDETKAYQVNRLLEDAMAGRLLKWRELAESIIQIG